MTARLLICSAWLTFTSFTTADAYIGKPCDWGGNRPQGEVRLRGLLQLSRYHSSPDSTRWSEAFSLDMIGTGCIVQVDAARDRLARCDGYLVELVGVVLDGGAVAPYTMIAIHIRRLRRYNPPSKSSNHAMQRTAGRRAFPFSITSTSHVQRRPLSPAVADLVSR
jgi:hypothetical protein